MSRDGLFEAVELRHGGSLCNALFVGFHSRTAREEATTIFRDRGTGELRVGSQGRWIGDRAIEGDPLGLDVSSLPLLPPAAVASSPAG